jgi:glyoxylase-like metal-dependent hydrolase (beta-lactamase superfamily II)
VRLSVLASGSSGNATYIETGGGGLLVDAGLSRRRIEALLFRIGRSLDDVGAVLLTHGHADHTRGVRSLVRERGVEVFAGPRRRGVARREPCRAGGSLPGRTA